jgi:hypothetical protein
LRLVIFISGFRRARLRSKIGTIMLGVVLLGVLVAAFALSILVLNALQSPVIAQVVNDPDSLLGSIPALVVTIATWRGIWIFCSPRHYQCERYFSPSSCKPSFPTML